MEDWPTALKAFTKVVQQESEEGDAWANVTVIHMYNKEPSEAYPALNENIEAQSVQQVFLRKSLS